MNKEQIITARKTYVSYFTYPTYPDGVLFEEEAKEFNDELHDEPANSPFVNCVDKVINEAVKQLGLRRDNKTAVKVIVDGCNEPLYFMSFDAKRRVCIGINDRKGGSEYSMKTGKKIN